MTQRWNARERVCGRMIEVGFDPKTGAIDVPAHCPECGASPVYVDLAEPIRKPATSAPGASQPAGSPPAIKATQAAADLAASKGIELASVKATGAGGTIITKADVEAAISAGKEGES